LRLTSSFVRAAFLVALAFGFIQYLSSQELSPRAYIITPVRSNAITLTWSFYDGAVDFNGVYPYSGTTGVYHVPVLSYYHAFSFFGRSANVSASLPYGVGHFEGTSNGTNQSIYRSGLLDLSARLSVNLYGGKAMPLQEFASWKQKKLLGASLKIVAPTGQYNGNALINWGINRWALKPELGYSQRWGHWILDGYAGAWFYTVNPEFGYGLPAPKPQTEAPVGSLEGHLSYDFPGRTLGLSRQRFLVGWRKRLHEQAGAFQQAAEFPIRGHSFRPIHQASVRQNRLQRWHICPFRRQLPERAGGVAILLDRETLVDDKFENCRLGYL